MRIRMQGTRVLTLRELVHVDQGRQKQGGWAARAVPHFVAKFVTIGRVHRLFSVPVYRARDRWLQIV